jgi:hypothetical protein
MPFECVSVLPIRWLAPVVILSAAGCFTAPSPDLTKLKCTTDQQCPAGYSCRAPNQVGGCCKPGTPCPATAISDAGNFDVVRQSDGGQFPVDAWAVVEAAPSSYDVPGTSVDGTGDANADRRDGPSAGSETQILSDVTNPDATTPDLLLPDGRSDSSGPDVSPDVPLTNPDSNGSCGQDSDCPGACQTCSATSHTCVAALNKADPNGRCAGTCDVTGQCKSKQGQSCILAGTSGCITGTSCADGYCCDRACTGACEACDSTPGTCAPVSGTPHLGHPNCAGTSAGCSGTCTGAASGQCTWGSAACGQATCTTQTNTQGQAVGTSFVAQGACNAGACSQPTAIACTGNLVCASAAACKTACTVDTDCLTGNICSAGTCAGKQGPGASCTTASQCSSNACVDGFCCETACTGTCMACSSGKTGAQNGLCRPVTNGTDPDEECSIDSVNTCGQDGMCNGFGGCRLRALGTSCGTQTCGGSPPAVTPAGTCNGGGTCIPATTTQPCNGFACSGNACRTTCTDLSTTGCAPGYMCVGGNSCRSAAITCGGITCQAGIQQCCGFSDGTGTYTFGCQALGQACNYPVACSTKAQCPSGQVCCGKWGQCEAPWSFQCVDPTNCQNGVPTPMDAAALACNPSLQDCPVNSACAGDFPCASALGQYTCL